VSESLKILIWVSIEPVENRSSKQFTELKNIEIWASYGQKSFSLNQKFHSGLMIKFFKIFIFTDTSNF